MIFSWTKAVLDSGKLTVYNGINAGQWNGVFAAALAIFNHNSGLKMKLAESASREDANVVMLLSAGETPFSFGGDDTPLKLDPKFGHGRTRMYRIDNRIEKVLSILPESPAQNQMNVLKMIATHELIHACGLDNDEHADDGVFMTFPNIQDGHISSTRSSKKMPPFFFTPKTKTKLAQYWS